MKTKLTTLLLIAAACAGCTVLKSSWEKFKATGDKVLGTATDAATNVVDTGREIVK
mgnify:CR=1 FL=1